MKFKNDFLYNYLLKAPLPLAIERSLECEILSRQKFSGPVLDIGCGDGLFAYILFKDKVDTGIEPNGRELECAKKSNIYQELVKCLGDKIPKENESYNTIYTNSTLEHIQDIGSVLEEAFRLLAENGRFYVTVPTDLFDRYTIIYRLLSFCRLRKSADRYRKFFNRFWKHYHFLNKEGWENLFSKYGFKIVESKEYDSKTVCLLNAFLAPFSLFSLLIKKTFNKWVILERVRGIYIYPFYLFVKYLIKRCEDGKRGGIIFFSLTK